MRFGGYGANAAIVRPSTPLTLAALNASAETYLLMDAGQNSVDAYSASTAAGQANYIPGVDECTGNPTGGSATALAGVYLDDYQTGRHFDGVNVGFADGHAKWLKSSTVCSEAKKGAAGAWTP